MEAMFNFAFYIWMAIGVFFLIAFTVLAITDR